MSLSSIFSEAFSSTIRERGLRYFKQDRVGDLEIADDVLTAVVRGSDDYRVTLFSSGADSLIDWSCTCPYFTDRGPCKHIWATILQAESCSLLSTPDESGAVRRLDDMEFYDGEEYVDADYPRPIDPRNRRTGQDRLPRWKSAMHEIQSATARRDSSDEPLATEYRYMVDCSETLRGRGTILRVLKTRPKKSGGWTKLKPVSFHSHAIEDVADPEDRRYLTLLEGGSMSDSYYYHPTMSDGTYQLSKTLQEILLPDLARTSRLYLAADFGDMDEAVPIALDEDGAWQFRLQVSKDAKKKHYAVSGYLSRNSEGMELREPDMLIAGGWMFYQNRLARVDDSGAFEWIPLLRRDKQLVVPFSEANEWLRDVISFRRMPPIALPEELQFRRVSVAPTPKLSVFAPKQRTDGSYLGAVLTFDYDGSCVPFSSDSLGIFDPEQRLVIDRDHAAEQTAARLLKDVRFRNTRAYYGSAYTEPCDFEIPAKRFLDAAVTLVEKGWHVEAEGQRYRPAGAITLSVTSGVDWFDVSGGAEFGDATASLPELLKALKKDARSVVLDDGTIGILPSDWLRRYGFLETLGEIGDDAVRFSRTQAAMLDALLAAESSTTFDDGFTRVCKELNTFTSVKPAKAPRGFKGKLRDYQCEGLGWLNFLQRFGFGGCLADDMGLGKTIQALALLESRRAGATGKGEPKKRPSLAVVPRSLIFNWKQEAERFAPRLQVLDHTGIGRSANLEGFGDYDLVLTTYGTLRSDILKLKELEFDYVILDEAQAIKNAATSTAKAARLLKARYRLALSGTPIENHLGELWSLFEFLNPGMLGTASAFKRGLSAAQNGDEESVGILSRALRPFVLRRTKSQVLKELPEKMEETIYCDLLPAQRKQYDELRDHYRQALLAKVDGDGIAKSKIMVLEALLRLRQAACHPGLLDKSKRVQSSAKLDVLLGQIQDVVDEDHKILVFSQFTSLLAIVRAQLDKTGVTYAYLDGHTRKREEVVARFQTDPSCKVFLISLKAGGLGLNLTAADYVVLLDPWWNPAVEAQAVDRSHRIGQTRRVFAYRIVARDTVEERILELQQKKKKLADSIITANNSLIRSLTRADIELLLA
ncbi:MAG: DEAD/DEAH box helicase [Verrucomicrobia bacterium]|nr:DEAD/DEAH box helicase [Verrucomicrobiota bacterium]MDA1086508.1 DEAD/DEAH box helicase [Verrucomicrobiota bacterium]